MPVSETHLGASRLAATIRSGHPSAEKLGDVAGPFRSPPEVA